MLANVKEYFKPTTVQEAFELFNEDRAHSVFLAGGTTVALMKSSSIERIIDLENVGLNTISEKDDNLVVGAMVKIEDFRKNELVRKHYGDFFFNAFSKVASWQLRNMATIGGSIAPKLGWSDVTACLIASDARLIVYDEQGFRNISIDEFNHTPKAEKPLITNVVFTGNGYSYSFKKFSKSTFDIAIINVAIGLKLQRDIIEDARIVVGSRPHFPVRFSVVEKGIRGLKLDNTTASIARNLTYENFEGGSNLLASAEYRQHLASIFVERALLDIREMVL
ncbi:MAG: FAD binding domain-containing protein [Kosmotoga sp.]|uniref:Molybdopterin dehydrogenase n=1 Tax=Kosmotoga arenicorallina TaxID=688066 RepID=A0A7C5DUQ7_9BACT|nr:FAD binding domain-containing protein [Kosmotoga sp.]MBO8166334.1 FAD binding domain-containing protein [Kosmotoga sp.]MCD6159962.1 FAD binding domain-containing protein [Kosmotoga sp.]HHF08224.1 molybdopterin dehydrogenase [Kosmotoga arenicorallina]